MVRVEDSWCSVTQYGEIILIDLTLFDRGDNVHNHNSKFRNENLSEADKIF